MEQEAKMGKSILVEERQLPPIKVTVQPPPVKPPKTGK
jgi:hypothetical protein